MRMLFGTDGIRGVAGDPPLDHNTVYAIGVALGRYLGEAHSSPQVVIGQDTRESSCWIADSLSQGLASRGARVQKTGVITTPAIAYLARQAFSAGVVVSASHNPWTDNGIKVFSHAGYKLPDELEERIESYIFEITKSGSARVPPPQDVPRDAEIPHPELLQQYVGWLGRSVRQNLQGLKILVDCANGAATPVAHEVFRKCGVEAVFIHDQPNGRNINENCGALHPEVVAAELARRKSEGFALGVTFDGDADRALFSDAEGRVVNGDAVLLLAGRDLKALNKLKVDMVVATTMSNMGLEIALRNSGIRMLRANVGDKYVLEEMQKSGAILGGEQSGHILFMDGDATTGDGLLTALRVMEVVVRSGRSLTDLVVDLRVFPQAIQNVRVREKKPFDQVPEVAASIQRATEELNGNGRVVVRYSGTEALARVMVEAECEVTMQRIADSICVAIQKTLGA